MSFPRYPKYRDSGVEWLGDIPGHWEVWKLAHAFKDIGSGTTPKSDNPAYYDDGTTPWLNTGDLNDGELYGCDKNVTALAFDEHSSLRLYPENSVAIAMYGATIGKLAILRFATTVNQACCVFGESQRVSTKFLFYWLFGLRQQIISLATGGGQPNISQDILRSLRLACPYLDEQHQIVTLLDRETAKIDALIAEQEKLITLLAEKRQAAISHAVTKGLNPDVPMKDSGVAWLGEMPEHWSVSPIKYIARVGNGSTPNRDEPKYWGEGSYPWLNSSVVNKDRVTEAEQFVTPLALKECHLPIVVPPAILVGITGQGRTRGMAATLLFEATINQHLVYIKPRSDCLNIDFLRRVFDMAYQYLRTESDSAGSTKGAITCDQILRLTIPLPSTDEQAMIVRFLDDETARLDALTNEAARGIKLLHERRSALISAAVTGKIDVRQVVSNEKNAIQKAA